MTPSDTTGAVERLAAFANDASVVLLDRNVPLLRADIRTVVAHLSLAVEALEDIAATRSPTQETRASRIARDTLAKLKATAGSGEEKGSSRRDGERDA